MTTITTTTITTDTSLSDALLAVLEKHASSELPSPQVRAMLLEELVHTVDHLRPLRPGEAPRHPDHAAAEETARAIISLELQSQPGLLNLAAAYNEIWEWMRDERAMQIHRRPTTDFERWQENRALPLLDDDQG